MTVLFVDVVGSTELAERAGVEGWRQLMERFFGLVCGAVHRFEGIVDRFTGDGAMAVFGAPLGDEHHAAHACHAALGLREELDALSAELRRERELDFVVRMGLNSGEVVVGAIGEDLDLKYTAVGHTVALAERMEGLAEPGKVYLTETTAREVGGYFELRDLGEFHVKGVRERVRAYELAGLGSLRTALEIARAQGFSQFVGRQDETRALESALGQVREGRGRVVCVVGEPGVGKSRVLYEFAERCRAEGIEVWQGHCRARGESLALMPMLELLRSYFGIGEGDSAWAARNRIAARALPLDPSLGDELPLLFDLLGVSDPERPAPGIDLEARQRRLSAALVRLLAPPSPNSPALLIFEDLQWIDPGSAAFLERLVDALPGTRTLVLASFRPPYQAEWMQRSYCARVALAPLAPRPSQELLGELLGEDPSLLGLAERLHQRAGGNPFFMEELVRGLAASGSLVGERGRYRLARPEEEQPIPLTVQAVIAARIDRLGEPDKQLLQTAAVIGREFSGGVLGRVAGISEAETRAGLHALLAAELIYERALAPDAEYEFRHQLIEEVAYRSQLSDPRARLQARVADVLEELYPDRLDELAALISHHREEAGEQVAAARWAARAAGWAGFADARGAMRLWRRAAELADAAPDSPEAVQIRIWSRVGIMDFGSRIGAEPEELRKAFEQARELAARSGDVRALALVVGMYAHSRTMAGDAAAYLDMHLEAIRLADQADDPAMRAAMEGPALALFVTGRLHQALEVMRPAFALWARDPTLGSGLADNPHAFCVWLRALTRLVLGELTIDQARSETERALALALAHGQPDPVVAAYVAQVTVCWFAADAEAALEHATRAVELAERAGGLSARSQAYTILGRAHILRREWDEALAAGQRSFELGRSSHTGVLFEPLSLVLLADAHVGRGQIDRGRELAKQAVAIAAKRGARWFQLAGQLALVRALIVAQAMRAESEFVAGARTEIDAALARAEALVEQMDAQGYAPWLHEGHARLAQVAGDTPTYVRELGEAQRLWETLGGPRAGDLAAELARLAATPPPSHRDKRPVD